MNVTQLTSIHGNLLQLCLMTQNLKPALEYIAPDISDVCSEVMVVLDLSNSKLTNCLLQNGHFDARHFLLFYFYGGLTCSAVKKFEQALYMFEVALTTPSSAVSHIMLESYKKYIMISLILHGKVGLTNWTKIVCLIVSLL